MSTYQKTLGPGEDIEVFAPAGEVLTATKNVKGMTRIRVKASGVLVPPPGPGPDPGPDPVPLPGNVPFGSRPVAARMDVNGGTDVVIDGKTFRNGTAGLAAIRLLNVRRAIIRNVDFLDVPGGIYLYQCEDVVVEDVRYQNITGPHTRTGANVGNLLQANGCQSVTLRRAKGKGGDTEDIVSLYKTGGSVVEDCHLEGTNWTSGSGSGIALGDDGGSGNVARRNILVNPGQVGIFIAGGTNSRIEDNIVIGQARPKSNVGIYVWNQYPTKACSGHTVNGNRVLFKKADGANNPYWNAGNCGPVAGSNTLIDNSLDIERYRVTL